MNIDKIKPIQYTPYEYWKKYKPYAHKLLYNYTSDEDLHDNLNSSLYFMFNSICRYIDYYKYPLTYIKQAIKMLIYRLVNYNGYKYDKKLIESKDVLLKDELSTELNTTLDNYLLNKQILKFINMLDYKHKTVVLMHMGIGYKHPMIFKDIAKEMHISANRARILFVKAVKQLKDLLNQEGFLNLIQFIDDEPIPFGKCKKIFNMAKNKKSYKVEDFNL